MADALIIPPVAQTISNSTYSLNRILGDLIASLLYGFLTILILVVCINQRFGIINYLRASLVISLAVAISLVTINLVIALADQSSRLLVTLTVFAFAGGVVGLLKSRLLTDYTSKYQSGLIWIISTSIGWLMDGGSAFVLLLFFLPLQN